MTIKSSQNMNIGKHLASRGLPNYGAIFLKTKKGRKKVYILTLIFYMEK
jgi:hypothetical protein